MLIENQLEDLDNFQGWGDETDGDFFNQLDSEDTPVSVKAEDVIEAVTEDEEKESKEEQESKEDSEELQDLFSQEDTRESDVSTFTEDEVEKAPNVTFLKEMKNRGLIDYEEEDLDEDLADELIEEKYYESLDNRIKEIFEELPDTLKMINNYVIKGGDMGTILKQLSNTSSLSEDVDLESEETQEVVLKQILIEKGEDIESAEALVEFYKDSGRLENVVKKEYQKKLDTQAQKLAELEEKQREAMKAQSAMLREAKKKAKTYLETNEAIGSLSISKNDIKSIPSYMNDKSVKLQNGSSITQMQKELYYDLPRNAEAMMQLAILMKNRNEDGTFNFNAVAKTIEKNVTKEVKDGVRRNKSNIPTSQRERRYAKKSLADYFS